MAVGRKRVDVGGFDVNRKRSESLDGIDKEEASAAPADLADGRQIGPEATDILDETDRKQASAAARFVDVVERVGCGEPLDLHVLGLEPLPGVIVRRKLLLEADDPVARPPVEAHRHRGYSLGGILHNRDRARAGVD